MMIDIAFFCILAAVGWIDQRTMEIPDRLSSAVLLLAVADQLTGGGPALFSSVLGTCAVSVPMLLMTLGRLSGLAFSIGGVLFGGPGRRCMGMLAFSERKGRKEGSFCFRPFFVYRSGGVVSLGGEALVMVSVPAAVRDRHGAIEGGGVP